MSIEIVTGAAAQANVASLPANVLIYGHPGTEKTTDAVRAFTVNGRCNAFVVPFEDGALKAIASRGLPVPDHPKNTVKSWADLYQSLEWLIKNRQNYTALVLDGLTPLSTYLYNEATASGGKNKYDIPMKVRKQLIDLRDWIRMIGLHSIFIAHPMAPVVLDGVFHMGAPLLTPKTMIVEFFGQVDTVLRTDYVQYMGQWQRVYYTGGTGEWPTTIPQPPDWRFWRTKNREGINSPIVPADLGGLLKTRQPPYAGI
ncbi:MAG TPA: AAA family ATPase [Vicinamibacterales bacterium]|nr:AAA family ATPase [Vicinamibacterales bacterium]